MNKIIIFLANLGKIITIYFIMFLLSLLCVSISPLSKNKSHERCITNIENYRFSSLNNINEISKYNVYLSCNTVDLLVYVEEKVDVSSLAIKLSFYINNDDNIQITIVKNNCAYYVKIKNSGEVIIV